MGNWHTSGVSNDLRYGIKIVLVSEDQVVRNAHGILFTKSIVV